VVPGVLYLLSRLGELPEPVAEPNLIIVSGLPGTGKSYFSKRLAERMPCLVLESDALRKTLFSPPSYSPRESAKLFRTIHQLLRELLEKRITVILDATNLSEKFREQLYTIADQLNIRPILVRVEAPPEVVYRRLESRAKDLANNSANNSANYSENNSDADWAVYRRMRPSVDKIQRDHYVVDTSKDINPVLDKIVTEVTHR
jgi:predicted kinase